MIEKIKELAVKYRELILYVIFGFVTTVANWIAYAVMVRALKIDLSTVKIENNVFYTVFHGAAGKTITLLLIANIVAWVVGVIVAFTTNKLWVFESKSLKPSTVLKELSGFIAARLATGFLEWFGIPALVLAGMNQSFLGIEGFPAKIIVSVVVIVANYVFSKFIVFRKKKKKQEE
ncbi:MAG: GtrA family protein [Eubacterium sp.]|nr:GtrA family protein [Eubacterium sp.]